MRVSELPLTSAIANGDKEFLALAGEAGRIAGHRILAIGFNEAQIDTLIVPHGPAEITVLTYWENHRDAKMGKYPLTVGDITKHTIFEDEAFDSILTLSVLEHVSDLDAALVEMKRLVKPGGRVANLFGPAWSCSTGHHLYIKGDDPLLNFSLWQMPGHMHFLSDAAEITTFYQDRGYAPDMVKKVIGDIFRFNGINRLMYEDYLEAFARHFEIEWVDPILQPAPSDIVDKLRALKPPYTDFETYGAKVILRKKVNEPLSLSWLQRFRRRFGL